MAELVDVLDLGSSADLRRGSSPLTGTNIEGDSKRVNTSPYKWIPASKPPPSDYEGEVLVLVTDKFNGIILRNAYAMAEYFQDDGWCLELWPDVRNPNVTHWTYLPELPDDI